MSIKTAIDSISNHIEDIYDTLELGGEDLTNKDKNINNIYTNIKNRYKDYLANGTDIIWDNWNNKNIQEGESLNFNNTIEAKIKTDLKGNTAQNTNILIYKCIGTESGDYYFVYNNINYQFTMPIISADDLLTFNTNTNKLYRGTTQITTTTANTGTLITLSSTPNPNYPQDIYIVTGDNTVKIVKKNLLTPAKTNGVKETKGMILTYSTSGEYILDGKATSSGNIVPGDYSCLKEIYTIKQGDYFHLCNDKIPSGTIQVVGVKEDSGQVFAATINSTNKIINLTNYIGKKIKGLIFYVVSEANVTNMKMTPMIINQVSIPTAYEPYTEQSQLISLGDIELCKIGDYQDKIFKAVQGNSIYDSLDSTTKASLTSGSWYKQGNIITKVLNGVEDWYLAETNTNTCRFYRTPIDIIRGGTTGSSPSLILSDHFSTVDFNTMYSTDSEAISTYGGVQDSVAHRIFIRIDKTVASDTTAFRSWLGTHNTKIKYVLATPTYTEITDTTLIAQLENIEKLKSYNNQTNILQINNTDLPFIINATVLQQLT